MRVLTFPQDGALLRRVALPMPEELYESEALRQYGEALGRLMLEGKGAGLAATQVDLDPCYRVIAVAEGPERFSVLCDPEIVGPEGEAWVQEGCLSFASVGERLAAPRRLTVRFRQQDGKREEAECEGFRARVVFHEALHLDGKLIIDRMGQVQRRDFMKRVGRVRREAEKNERTRLTR